MAINQLKKATLSSRFFIIAVGFLANIKRALQLVPIAIGSLQWL